MICRMCGQNTATHTITIHKEAQDYDVCKNCVDELRTKDKDKELLNPSFSVRCVWKNEP